MERQIFPNKIFWRLDLAIGFSREFKPRANGLASLGLLSCSAIAGATLQLLTCLARVQLLATCKPRVTYEIQSRDSVSLHNLKHFFTLSHSLPLQVSYLNTGLLSAKLQVNWHGIKPTRWLIKFNLIVINQSLTFI